MSNPGKNYGDPFKRWSFTKRTLLRLNWPIILIFVIVMSGWLVMMGKDVLIHPVLSPFWKTILIGFISVLALSMNRFALHFFPSSFGMIEIWIDRTATNVNLNLSSPNGGRFIDFRIFLNIMRDGANENLPKNLNYSFDQKGDLKKLEFGILRQDKNVVLSIPLSASLIEQIENSPDSYFVATAVYTHEFTGIRTTSSTVRLYGYHLLGPKLE